MKLIKPTALALAAALGVIGAIAVADAQTQPPNPPGPPGAAGPGPRGPGMGPGMGPGGDGPGWRMGRMGPDGEMGPGWRRQKLSKEDRAAFLNAKIAAVHAGLGLNADQEKLWPPVESAVRDIWRGATWARGRRNKGPKRPANQHTRAA